MSPETALLIVSAAFNAVLAWAALAQRYRLRAAAVARCADCPFARLAATPAAARITLPAFEEPKTLLLARAHRPTPLPGAA